MSLHATSWERLLKDGALKALSPAARLRAQCIRRACCCCAGWASTSLNASTTSHATCRPPCAQRRSPNTLS
eukprot:9467490-Pyramimonas_sp.AAC.1